MQQPKYEPQPADKVQTRVGAKGIIVETSANTSLIWFSDLAGAVWCSNNQLTLIEPATKDHLGSKTGFDPETLTFDGLEIKAGDEVKIGIKNDAATGGRFLVGKPRHPDYDDLSIHIAGGRTVPLHALNITAHYPKQTQAEKDLQEAKDFVEYASTRGEIMQEMAKQFLELAEAKVKELKNNNYV